MSLTKRQRAARARWVGISPEEKTRRMSAVSMGRWSKATKKERKAVGLQLAKARKGS